jgi:hypothetical protein
VGLTVEEAQRLLEDSGLKLGSQDEAPSNEVAEGAVVWQDPAAGTEAERGTAVDLVLSTGPAQDLPTQASPSATPSASSSATSSPSSSALPARGAETETAEEAKKPPPGGPHKNSPAKSPPKGKDK